MENSIEHSEHYLALMEIAASGGYRMPKGMSAQKLEKLLATCRLTEKAHAAMAAVEDLKAWPMKQTALVARQACGSLKEAASKAANEILSETYSEYPRLHDVTRLINKGYGDAQNMEFLAVIPNGSSTVDLVYHPSDDDPLHEGLGAVACKDLETGEINSFTYYLPGAIDQTGRPAADETHTLIVPYKYQKNRFESISLESAMSIIVEAMRHSSEGANRISSARLFDADEYVVTDEYMRNASAKIVSIGQHYDVRMHFDVSEFLRNNDLRDEQIAEHRRYAPQAFMPSGEIFQYSRCSLSESDPGMARMIKIEKITDNFRAKIEYLFPLRSDASLKEQIKAAFDKLLPNAGTALYMDSEDVRQAWMKSREHGFYLQNNGLDREIEFPNGEKIAYKFNLERLEVDLGSLDEEAVFQRDATLPSVPLTPSKSFSQALSELRALAIEARPDLGINPAPTLEEDEEADQAAHRGYGR